MKTRLGVFLSEVWQNANHPHASGQVFWTAALAPPRFSRALSYCNGVATTLGWIFANAGTYVFSSQIWIAAMQIRFSGYQAQTYHVFLVCLAMASFGVILNVWLFLWYPHFTRFMVWFFNANIGHDVFVKVINESGWSSNGLVFLLNFLPGCVALACFDTAAHMAEEMEDLHRQVPQVMVGATAMCALTAIPIIVAFLFCIVKPENLLAPIGGQPVFQVLIDGFRSDALVVIALIINCIVYLSSCPATITIGSRLVWSFAKHGGLPFSKRIGHVEPTIQVPVNAVYLTAATASLICLLVFGPSTVLNGVFGAGSACFFISYGLPIWLLLWQGRKALPKQRYFNLGRIGVVVNIITVCWQFLSIVFLNFPLYQPVTATNMNCASVCAMVGLILFGVNWFAFARKHY
ncbi:amino acid transporter [Fusarium napiforme]|uniref:Amino acid transporter n=1 Tax=Fusarium napiforme TaxID=42672 RepID=A0A8H5IWZ2_9HYPO|nr:amino acid transporter [Fusarium napiforme]